MVRSTQGKRPEYFEAILQLRDCTQEVRDFAQQEIKRIELPVAKIVEVKGGTDYYLADNTQSKKVGKALQERFGGEYLVTATLHTKKQNKELYRITILFRQAHFKRGDEVEYQGEKYNIKAMGKDIFMQNVKTGKKIHLKYNKMREIKKIK